MGLILTYLDRRSTSIDPIFTAPPDLRPNIILETSRGITQLNIESNNHFMGMLRHFCSVIQNPLLAELELSQNIRQAQLIEQFRTLANG